MYIDGLEPKDMATQGAGMMFPSNRVFPSITPALVMSMGFIDLGKWVVAVEGGVQFGFNLMLLVLLFSCSAMFCQYLATCVGMVTGKNLAQICCEEYSRPVGLLLGLQVDISLIVSDMTNILGIAHGINYLFGLDLSTCTILAAFIVVSLSMLVIFLDSQNSEMLYVGISGSVLLFFVFGLLLAQPEVTVGVNGLFPRLSGENSYLIMALLGSNVIVHNFYSQSSLVQHQRSHNIALESALQDHLFAILLIFSGIFLANCVLMNSAASLFDSASISLFSFQDIILLTDQMFSIRIAPVAFFLVLLLSGLVKSLAWMFGGKTVVHNFYGDEISSTLKLSCLKFLAIVPAIFCAQSSGIDIYQLLIFCQVTLAVLLPSSVIPLFRVASSKTKMGNFTMSWYLEIVALFTSIWMLASNVIFLFEMLFGNSSWIVNLRTSMTLSFVFLLVTACTSLCLTFYLMVTPLKSASNESFWELENNLQFVSNSKNDNFIGYEVQKPTARAMPLVSEKSSLLDSPVHLPEKTTDINCDRQSTTGVNFETASSSSTSDIKESTSVFDLQPVEPSDKLYDCDTSSANSGGADSNEPLERTFLESTVSIQQGEEFSKEPIFPPRVLPPIPNEVLEPVKSTREKPSETASGPGSLLRLSGLGRAARRQFAAILDEFWGHLFDFHGQLIEEAKANKVDILVGLDADTGSSGKTDGNGHDVPRKHLSETNRGLAPLRSTMDLSNQARVPSKGSSYGFQAASPVGVSPWLSNSESLYMYGQNSGNEALDPTQRRYSGMQTPQSSDMWDYQPATIHGYQISSYLRGLATGNKYDSSVFPVDQSSAQKCLESTYKDSLAPTMRNDRFSSMGISRFENQAFPPTSRQTDFENPYDPSYYGISESLVAPEKKYHSLPDISGLSIAGRASSFANRNNLIGSRIGSPSGGRNISQEQTQLSSRYRAEGSLLTFDELSPPKDIFSLRSASNADNSSLWSKQPYEQLFGMTGASINQGVGPIGRRNSAIPEKVSYAEMEMKLLNSLKNCIVKLLKLDGSDWLFKQDAGADEELIDQLVLKEKFVCETSTVETSLPYLDETHHFSPPEHSSLQNNDLDFSEPSIIVKCGESCIWRAGLVVSFGVWCIRRILELSLVESRPELWGKYTYVLNRLQGIVGPAFSKPRSSIPSCPCLQIPVAYEREYGYTPSKPGRSLCTTSAMVLEIIKEVETAISSRKGRVGTAAGDVAFPKGKENLASVLKRYKRRLSNKPSSAHQGSSGSRRTSQQAIT